MVWVAQKQNEIHLQTVKERKWGKNVTYAIQKSK